MSLILIINCDKGSKKFVEIYLDQIAYPNLIKFDMYNEYNVN